MYREIEFPQVFLGKIYQRWSAHISEDSVDVMLPKAISREKKQTEVGFASNRTTAMAQ